MHKFFSIKNIDLLDMAAIMLTELSNLYSNKINQSVRIVCVCVCVCVYLGLTSLSTCVCVCVCVYLGLTSLSTIFQSYHDGVWLRQGAQCSLL